MHLFWLLSLCGLLSFYIHSSILKNTRMDVWYVRMVLIMAKRSYRALERIVRGFSNHRRIEIMNLLHKTPELSVVEISEALRINFKTASEHIRRLALSDLVLKRNDVNHVRHKLTRRAESILKFLRTLE